MESQVTEVHTWPSQQYTQSFFSKQPTDERFLQTAFHKFGPSQTLDSRLLEIKLDKYDAANLYLIQDTYVQVSILMTTSSGALPDVDKKPVLCNNIVHSMFESVKLYINDDLISNNASDYPFRGYISSVLSFPQACKATHLQTQGYYNDTAKHFGNVSLNFGAKARNAIFREDGDIKKPYKEAPITLLGRVHHELMNISTGIPPGTKVRFEFIRASDKFLFINEEGDNEKYKLQLHDITLLVPIAQMSSSIYSEINSVLASKEGPKALTFHFRRTEIKPISIPAGKLEHNTESVFPDCNLPARMVIVFVNSKARLGDRKLNPFYFARHWDIPVNTNLEHEKTETVASIETVLNKRFQKFEAKFEAYLKNAFSAKSKKPLERADDSWEFEPLSKLKKNSGSGSEQKSASGGRRKSSKNSNSSLPCPESTSKLSSRQKKRVEEYIKSLQKQNHDESDSEYSSAQENLEELNDDPDPPVPSTKRVYIRKVQCILQGNPVDQLEINATAQDDMEAFFRMYYFTGQQQSLFSCGISYTDFLNGYYFVVFDLSTAGKAGNTFLVPAVRVGHLRLRVVFSEPLPHELTMLLFCEYPSVMYLNQKTGKVTTSFMAM